MDMEQTESVALSIIFILTTILGMVYIIRKAILKFMVILHITCLFGTFIILTAAIFDLLRKLTIMEYSNYTSLYFLCTTLTSILSCYVILQVGMNFYQDYTFMRTSLMFAPVMVSMGTFVLATFTAIRKSLDQSIKETTSTREFEMITFYLSLAVGVLSLIYCVYPLFTIKSQVRLEPQQTAVSFVHFFIVVILFTTHFVVYALVTLKGYPVFERDFNITDEFLLLLIFPGCLFTPPRGIVKLVKRRLLGVEQLTIGGDYRPDTLANGYNSRAPVLSTISPPMAPSSRSIQTPLQNSTSPRRSESPLIRDSFYPKTSLSMPVRVNSIESDTSFYLNRFFGRSNDPPNQKTNPLQNRTDPPRGP